MERAGVGNIMTAGSTVKNFPLLASEAEYQSKPGYAFRKVKFTVKFPSFAFLLTHETRSKGPRQTE